MLASRSARRLPLMLAALVAAPLLLGACSSSSTTADQPPATSAPAKGTAVTTTTGADTTTTTVKRSTSTTGDSTTTTTEGTTTTKVVTDAAYTQLCAAMVSYNALFKNADPTDPTWLPKAKSAYTELLQLAPPAIHDDVATVSAYVQTMTSFNDFLAAPENVKDAGIRLGQVTEEQCGVS